MERTATVDVTLRVTIPHAEREAYDAAQPRQEGNYRSMNVIKNAETDGTGDNGLALLAREEP